MHIDLFTFDINKKELVVNNVELLAISCFSKLINTYDFKEVSINQVFAYIYWHGSIFSPGMLKGLTGEELSNNAKVFLSINQEWQPNDLVFECINTYKKLNESAARNTLENLLVSLNTIGESTKLITKGLQTVINGLKEQTEPDMTQISKIINANKNINDIIKELPKNIEMATNLLDSLKSGNTSISIRARGDQEISSSMLPD